MEQNKVTKEMMLSSIVEIVKWENGENGEIKRRFQDERVPSQELSCYNYKRHHDLTLSESNSSDLAGIVEPLNPASGHILVPHKNHTNIMKQDKVTKEMMPSNMLKL